MFFSKKPVATAVSLALAGYAMTTSPYLLAQTTPPAAEATKVVVTGIRASIEKSLYVKENASANVEVITAEDVGKMPDKNLADSLQRLVGVAVRTDYDEAEKVSMRGTNPDMSLILFNGHTVSGGDWYSADQQSTSRSTSLSLMPSSVLNQAIVYKTSQANIADGGLAGTINVTTRKPLDEKANFGGVISGGATYASLPDKTAPNLNATLNWKNEANNFGLIGQVFSEKRYIRRDAATRAAEDSGWTVINTATMKGITDASLAGTGLKAADLNGVRMPPSMSAELAEGVRDRKGVMFSAQLRPNKDLDVTATGFYSSMDANNYGRLTSGAFYSMLTGANQGKVYASILNPVIVNETTNYGFPLRVLQGATIQYPTGTAPQYIGNSQENYRDGAHASSGFLDVDAKYRYNKDLVLKALFSTTKGEGSTGRDNGVAFIRYGTGATFQLNGLQQAPDSSYIGAGQNQPGLNADGSGYSPIPLRRAAVGNKTTDKEQSLALDGEYTQGSGVLSSLLFGYRYADHQRLQGRWVASVRTATPGSVAGYDYAGFPGNFGGDLNGNNWDNTGFFLTPDALKAYVSAQHKPTSLEFERNVANEYDVREKQTAVYAMQNLEGERWSGNVGLRFTQTHVLAKIPMPLKPKLCPRIEPGQPVVPCAAAPDAINTAASAQNQYLDGVPFDPLSGVIYYKKQTDKTFTDVLPSLNLRYELQPKLIGRVGLSRTIGRQNYNIWGVGFSSAACSAGVCTVRGPNPDMKPLKADNADLSLAWYFAPRSVALINLYRSKISGYPKTGTDNQGTTVDLVDPADNAVKPFYILSSSQQGAHVEGIELGFERPIGGGFGIQTNLSRARTGVDDGRPMVGESEFSANIGGYFENDKFSARLVYNYRGKYVASSTAPAPTANSQGNVVINGVTMPVALLWAAPVSNVALSLNYDISKNLRVSFDATNLTNPTRAQYYYSEAEPARVDAAGRQYYLTFRYKI